jgi:hypothetical protein
MKLIPSPNPKKKWRAVFETKHTDFGDAQAEDYTQHKDKERRDRYRKRHEKDLKTNDPTRAGYLAYFLLWGDSVNLKTNLSNYKKMYNL